jgi:hypothetical protein
MAAAEVPTQRKLPAPDHAQLAIVPALTPVELLRIAVSQNADIDKLKQLMDMQERWERNEARKAFVVAMNAFKSEPTKIVKNKHVHFETQKGSNDYNHATLDHVCDAVIGGLSKHGISHRWKVEQEKEWIKVTCVLRHDMGWEEETTLMGTADNTGSKNSIQAVGSTVTYLQRYTLLAATGLAAADTDTDGRPPTINAGIPSDRVNEQCEWMANAKDLDELKRLFRTAYSEADGAKDRSAMSAYIAAKDRRKRELE